MERYSDEISKYSQLSLEILHSSPSMQFVVDMLYYLSREYVVGWRPQCLPDYSIQICSSFNAAMQDAANLIIRNSNEVLNSTYDELVRSPGDKDTIFLHHLLNTFMPGHVRYASNEKFFKSLLFNARLCLVFYQRGEAYSLPDLAAVYFKDAVERVREGSLERLFSEFTKFSERAFSGRSDCLVEPSIY